MNFKTIKCTNYNIYLYKTTKFKTVSINTMMISDYKPEEITKNKFISEYLVNSNNNYKDEVSMSKKYMSLYEPRIDVFDYYTDLHSKSYTVTFLNEKYTEKGLNKETIDFYFDIMFNPTKDNNSFEENNFNIVKNKMTSWYKMDEEDSRSMAFFNSMKHISDDLPIKNDIRGNLNDLNKIKKDELLDYYFKKINKSKFYVFVVGDYNDDLINSIKENLDGKVKDNEYKIKNYLDVTKVKKEQVIEEAKPFNQSILFLIYKGVNLTDREREYVLPVFDTILGGSSSKLFKNVREKNSLAYYAYSSYSKSNNILYMYAGISKENYDKSLKLMKEQLEEIKNGNISKQEIKDSISDYKSNGLKTLDSINGYINELRGYVFFNNLFFEDRLKNIKTVTKEEIINISKKFELDVTYLLKGDK